MGGKADCFGGKEAAWSRGARRRGGSSRVASTGRARLRSATLARPPGLDVARPGGYLRPRERRTGHVVEASPCVPGDRGGADARGVLLLSSPPPLLVSARPPPGRERELCLAGVGRICDDRLLVVRPRRSAQRVSREPHAPTDLRGMTLAWGRSAKRAAGACPLPSNP